VPQVDGLEHFIHLKDLVLDYNQITSRVRLPRFSSLSTLCVNSNNISDLKEWMDVLQSISTLRYLSMLKNPACPNFFVGKDQDDYQRYRYYVVHRLPHLTHLDSTPVTEAERKEAQRVGHLMLPAKPVIVQPSPPPTQDDQQYEALPADLTAPGVGSASFGKSRYTYHGKQSEGNRFILNSDL